MRLFIRFNSFRSRTEIVEAQNPPEGWSSYGIIDASQLDNVQKMEMIRAHPPGRRHHPNMVEAAAACDD
jgi:hypothetical protein